MWLDCNPDRENLMGFDSSTAVLRPLAAMEGLSPARVDLRRAAMIGNFPPRKCGIATFTRDTFECLREAMPLCTWRVVAMEDQPTPHDYPQEVTDVIPQDDLESYSRVADELNRSGVEAVFIQHEFGIFGGDSGSHLLTLIRRLRMPVIVTLHTILEKPTPVQKQVLDEIIRLASAVIVMSETGADILARVHRAGPAKVHVIPHGAPERPFAATDAFKAPIGLEGHKVIMTFGLLSPNKGLETIIKGLPQIAARHPDAVYLIVGATHPHLVAREGEAYRESLIELARSLGVEKSLRFVNRYVDDTELVSLLQAADIYATPYLTESQVTSGTLSYAVALGKPVVSTPYWHASELLADDVGVICPFNDWQAFANAISGLLRDDVKRNAMARRAYQAGQPSRWSKVAEATINVAVACRSEYDRRTQANFLALARPRLDGLLRMSDDCGVFQHSRFGAPDRHHGYCTDDTARALGLLARLSSSGSLSPAAVRLAETCASFVSHAWNRETGRFRNFMGFDRSWLDEGGSDDCCARALEAVCLMARHWPQPDLRDWAADLAREVFQHVAKWPALRAHAFLIKAALTARDCVIGEEEATRFIRTSADVLLSAALEGRAAHGWFEPVLSYDNARLPEALILAGEALDDGDMLATGLETLDLLMKRQVSRQGWFTPAPTSRFDNGADHPLFDQQPIEALATIEASFAAWRATGDTRHAVDARLAFDWFGGHNIHALPLARPEEGICFDGLTIDGVNRNHGAESILSYQFAALAVREFLLRLPGSAT